MNDVCIPCKGTGKVRGGQLCRHCNPSGAIGDIVLGFFGRLGYRLAGKRMRTDGKTTARRDHRFGSETVTLTTAEKRARQAARRRQEAAGQQPARRTSASTTPRKRRCKSCKGMYSPIKNGGVWPHNKPGTSQPCPGGGARTQRGRS